MRQIVNQIVEQKPLPKHEHLDSMTWLWPYVPGTYRQNTVTRIDRWTFVANKETTQNPSPIVVFPYQWLAPNTPAYNTVQYGSQAVCGIYVVNDQGAFFQINSMRIWVGSLVQTYSPYLAMLSPNFRVSLLGSFLGSEVVSAAGQWAQIPVGNEITITPGEEYEFGVRIDNSTTTEEFGYTWNFSNNLQNNTNPGSGNCNRNTQHNTFRISDTAGQGGGDVSSDLDKLVPGTTVRVSQQGVTANYYLYLVNDVIDHGGWRQLSVSLDQQGGVGAPNGWADVQFTVPTGSASYEVQANYWEEANEAKGFLRSPSGDTVTDQNLYNVDIHATELELQSDWDVLTIAGI